MADSSYPPASSYFPEPFYATPSHGHDLAMGSHPDQDLNQRKRPKYTRSKTGCLTCRVKKIKCDETKPNCMRCTHGQRECTWPEGVPPRKKSGNKDSGDGFPALECSPEPSPRTPPMRDPTPPKRSAAHIELSFPPSRRQSEQYMHLHHAQSPATDLGYMNRHNVGNGAIHLTNNSSHINNVPLMSGIPAYSAHAQYDHGYPLHVQAGHSMPASRASVHSNSYNVHPFNHNHPGSQWGSSITNMDPAEYYASVNGVPLAGHSPHDHYPRYQ